MYILLAQHLFAKAFLDSQFPIELYAAKQLSFEYP